MQLACTTPLAAQPAASLRRGNSRRAALLVTAQAKKQQTGKRRLDAQGYIVDNTERGNIFAVEPKQLYTSSPTSDAAARRGLGGIQGLAVLGALLGLVALATLGVAKNPADTLQGVASSGDSLESLSAIAGRLSSSL